MNAYLKKAFSYLAMAVFTLASLQVSAQTELPDFPYNLPHKPRIDDHFWRRKVHYRLDLKEKINDPMMKAESQLYLPSEGVHEGNFANTRGIVYALLAGHERGDYEGYNPDSLEVARTFMEVKNMMKSLQATEGSGAADGAGKEATEELSDEGDDFGDDFGGDEDATASVSGDALPSGEGDDYKKLFLPLTFVLDIVENRIFDKNKSDMYYDIQYIRLHYIDPAGQLRDRPVVAYKYEHVKDVLNSTQWKNRFNDSEYRSLQEIFELRLFNGYNIEISGINMQTIDEGDKRNQQMLEFEHHLWEF